MDIVSQENKKTILNYRKEAISLKASINIGKNGITNQLIDEIKRQLKINKLIKIKIINKNINDIKKIALNLIKNCNANLINIIGHTIVLYKK